MRSRIGFTSGARACSQCCMFCENSLQYQSVFQSSNLIGWVRVNLGCCQGNGHMRI